MAQIERAHPDVALPAVVHRVADDVPASTRVIIIGDVHGCFDELQLLLSACDFSPPNDCLVFVGDLVNKGPKPLDVVRFVRESGSLCVRGNHDDAALSAFYQWINGGRVPGSAKYSYVEHFKPEDVEFLEQLPFSVSLPNHSNIIVVHAGVVPEVNLEEQRPVDIHVYFGHAASAGLQQESFATGLDTGCCYGKKLTACIIPSNRLVQVDAKEQYEVPSGDKN
ncbi:hypothetical protein PInf_023611 [Phytophthora infestans]|nr:hypothetical protein PInf_023611 [Phytophthora infestans]